MERPDTHAKISARAAAVLLVTAGVAPLFAFLPWAIWRSTFTLLVLVVCAHQFAHWRHAPVRGSGQAFGFVLAAWMTATALFALDRHLAVNSAVFMIGNALIMHAIAMRSGDGDVLRHARIVVVCAAAWSLGAAVLYATGVTPEQFCFTLKDQNVLGAALVAVGPLSAYLALAAAPGAMRALLVVAAVLVIGGALATGSRGAAVGLVVGLGVSLAVSGGASADVKRLRIYGVGGALAFFLTPVLLRLSMLDAMGSSSFAHRVFIWQTSLRMAIAGRLPYLTGVGIGNYRLGYISNRPFTSRESYALAIPADAHSDAMDFLAMGGVIGCLIAVCLIVLVARAAFRQATERADDPRRGLGAALFGGLVGWALNGLLNSSLSNDALQPWLFALMGLVVAARGAAEPGGPPTPGWRLAAVRPVALVALAVAAQQVLRTLIAGVLVAHATWGGGAQSLVWAARIDPMYNVPYELLGGMPDTIGRDRAIEALRTSSRLVPTYHETRSALGHLLLESGHREEGLRELRAALDLDRLNGSHWLDLAHEDSAAPPGQRLRRLNAAAFYLELLEEVSTARYGPGSPEVAQVQQALEEARHLRREIMGREGP